MASFFLFYTLRLLSLLYQKSPYFYRYILSIHFNCSSCMQNAFIELAKTGKNNLWLYLAGFILVLVFGLIFSAPVIFVTNPITEKPSVAAHWYLSVALLQFIGVMVALWIAIRFIHQRSFSSLISSFADIRWKRMLLSAGIWIGLSFLVEIGLCLLFPEMYHYSLHWKEFLPAFVVGVLMIPIQSSAEELLFRGYLLQGIGSRNPWLGVAVSSILFGLAHSANPEIEKVGLVWGLSYYTCFGLFAALLTLWDKGLELAMGVHAANNIYSFLIVSYPDSVLPSPSIFSLSELNFPLMIAGWMVTVCLYLLVMKRVGKLEIRQTLHD